VSASKNGSQQALDKAIQNAVEKKMAYNAQRIARTEMARAWGEETLAEFQADPDIAAIQWELSSSDNACPDCIEISQDDIGHGPGIYTAEELPEYPFHPNCLCRLAPVFIDEFKT